MGLEQSHGCWDRNGTVNPVRTASGVRFPDMALRHKQQFITNSFETGEVVGSIPTVPTHGDVAQLVER